MTENLTLGTSRAEQGQKVADFQTRDASETCETR